GLGKLLAYRWALLLDICSHCVRPRYRRESFFGTGRCSWRKHILVLCDGHAVGRRRSHLRTFHEVSGPVLGNVNRTWVLLLFWDADPALLVRNAWRTLSDEIRCDDHTRVVCLPCRNRYLRMGRDAQGEGIAR